MVSYIIRRLLLAIPTLGLAALIIFLLLYVTPGDPVTALIGTMVDIEVIEQIRDEWGFNDPLHLQFFKWLPQILRGNLGVSYRNGQSVAKLLARKAPITITLTLAALALATVVGVPLGIICGLNRNTLVDRAVTLIALAGVSVPAFWLAYLLVFVFALKLGWLPALGYVSPTESFAGWLSHAILPAVCLSVGSMARITRMTRSSLLEVLQEEYVQTARAKGLPEIVVIYKHMLKNAIIPVVTVIGMSFALLMAGVVTVELVLCVPGVGKLLIGALANRDYPVVQGIVLWLCLAFIVINLIVDISYAFLDPRVKYE